jgi:hypothetical protein
MDIKTLFEGAKSLLDFLLTNWYALTLLGIVIYYIVFNKEIQGYADAIIQHGLKAVWALILKFVVRLIVIVILLIIIPLVIYAAVYIVSSALPTIYDYFKALIENKSINCPFWDTTCRAAGQ